MSCPLVYAQLRPSPDEQHLPLSFDFPEGSLVGIAKEKLPVNVTFTGSRPTSFTANVVFLDEDGKRFSLPITGTTDASLLTIKSFLDVRKPHLWHCTGVHIVVVQLLEDCLVQESASGGFHLTVSSKTFSCLRRQCFLEMHGKSCQEKLLELQHHVTCCLLRVGDLGKSNA